MELDFQLPEEATEFCRICRPEVLNSNHQQGVGEMDKMTNYYKLNEGGTKTIYDVWEQGKNHGDSVTPSTWCPAYKDMMTNLLERYTRKSEGASVISLGCGNAVIEANLVSRGFNVTGLDLNKEAISYARKKGLRVIENDFYTYEPDERYDVVYADGFFGHLYGVNDNVSSVYQHIAEKLLKREGVVIISNDAPRDTDCEVQVHPHVPDFQFLSPSYLAGQANLIGMSNIEVNTFYYFRPISGQCPRAIVISKFN
jgi:hypothetical protein